MQRNGRSEALVFRSLFVVRLSVAQPFGSLAVREALDQFTVCILVPAATARSEAWPVLHTPDVIDRPGL